MSLVPASEFIVESDEEALLTHIHRHLTAVENRLQSLESVLGRLFATGEMEAITRALLINDDPTDNGASNDSNRQVAVNDPFPSDPAILDDILNSVETSPPVFEADYHMDIEPQAQTSFRFPELSVTAEEEREFLNRYFLHFHTLYPILHERKFRLEYESHIASQHMPVLANMVLAIGAWLSTNARQDLDKMYFAKAQDHVRKLSMEDKGDITLVQGLVLLSEFS